MSEDSPRSAPFPLEGHLFAARAGLLAGWDAPLAEVVSRHLLREAVDQVPETFLQPLLAAGADAAALVRRRRAYEAFLWKRLKAPRPFVRSGGMMEASR